MMQVVQSEVVAPSGPITSLVYCSDENFERYRVDTIRRIRELVLPKEPTPTEARMLISFMDEVYTLVHLDFVELESEKERLESIIRQCERSKTEGKNELDRKRNATLYLENFPQPDGSTVDIYESWRIVYKRYNHLKHCLDILENKQARMITISGYMKIDASFAK